MNNQRFFQTLILLSLSAILFGCLPKHQDKPRAYIPPQHVNLQPILRLDTGGHMSIINDLIVTSDKKHLISCSDDKTIRVWDMQTKKEVRKILGEIGKGSFGMVYAIALSPDDRFLAVGGFFSESRIENVDMVSIRIYNFPTGELLHILKSHKNIVSDLSFSSDGQYLVSSSLDYTVKIWDATDEFKLVHTFSEHTDDVYAVRIFRHQEDYRVVSAAHDHEVIFRSLNRKEMLASFSHDDRTGYLAVSRKYIASSGYDKKINIFDLNLTHIKTIESETIPTGLAFSPDGKLLLAGTGDNPLNCNIYDNEQSFKILHSFQKHENLTRAIAFADNTTAVTGGGDNLDIWFWNPRTGETKDHIAGGKNVWSVGIESDEIAFGNTFGYQDHNHRGLLEKGFSLSAFTPFQPKNFSEFNRIFTRFRKYTLSHTQGGPYGYNEGILLVKKGGEVISRIERDSTNGLGHNCYGFTPDGTILSGGSNGHLKAYNTDGDEIADFTGHTGEVWAIALDGNRLVSGGDDQVIHVWDLDKLKQGQTQVSPSFSLFVSNDNQWVVWTPEGFFNASEYGTKYIGFHINRGEENAAEYISADQLYDQYYRPDLVAKRIQGGHEDEIQAELSRIGNIDDILKSGLPPILEMVNAPAGKIRNRDLTLKLKLTDRGGGIGKIVFRVNGIEYGIPQGTKPIGHIGMKSSGMIIRKDFTLKNGLNTITATAYNKDDKIESKPLEFILNVDDPRSYEPDLYGLCIGITNYLDYDLKLKYAADDALSMRKELETRATPLFKNVDVRALTDRQASTDGIISAFKEMSLKIRPNDVFVLYMSGHGKALDTRYHFIPWGMRYKNEESIRQYSLSHDKIQELMAMIRAQKSLIILDTCYSGSVVAPSKGMPEKTAIDRLMRATGRATLAATSDKALAYEGHNGHGIFTHAILKGLEAHADRKGNRNGETGIDELANFVQDEVPRITFDKFGFEQIPMHSVTGHSFPIGCCKGYNRPGCRP